MHSNILALTNTHPRDAHITFQEEGHKYTIHTDLNSKYTSVTTWNHSHFPHFNADQVIANMMKGKNWNPENKYWNMTSEEIKKLWTDNGAAVSGAGTEMHEQIECFMNNPHVPYPYTQADLAEYYLHLCTFKTLSSGAVMSERVDADCAFEMRNDVNLHRCKEDTTKVVAEWQYFLDFLKNNPTLKPYRTEWMIYHEDLKLSGSIDMVYENPDGTLLIYDWKRSKEINRVNKFNKYAITQCIDHLPDSNFWHYSMQLNTYKAILEAKYEKKVVGLYLVRLHPDASEKTYDLIKVPDLSNYIEELFQLRKNELHL